jgi:hypothetical protein
VDEERKRNRLWALILLMSGALRSGPIVPLTLSLVVADLRSTVSTAAAQSAAVGDSVGGLTRRPYHPLLDWLLNDRV